MANLKKTVRGRKQAIATRYLNALNRHLTEEDASEVKIYLEKAKCAFTDFENAHFQYHDLLENE